MPPASSFFPYGVACQERVANAMASLSGLHRHGGEHGTWMPSRWRCSFGQTILPTCVYLEKKLETTLSGLVSLTKTDMQAATMQHFLQFYGCVTPTNNRESDSADPNLSSVMLYRGLVCLRALVTHSGQGRPLLYIGLGSQDEKGTGRMAWQRNPTSAIINLVCQKKHMYGGFSTMLLLPLLLTRKLSPMLTH